MGKGRNRNKRSQTEEQPHPSTDPRYHCILGPRYVYPRQLIFLVPFIIAIYMLTSINYQFSSNRWMAVVGLSGDAILVVCDAFLLYYTPLMTSLLMKHLFCTGIVCFLHCLGNYGHFDWIHHNKNPSSYLFMISYCITICVKMYLLLPMLNVYGSDLGAFILIEMPQRVVHFLPLPIVFFSPVPIRFLKSDNKHLHILKLIVQALESSFLNAHSKVFGCDENINLTAEYIKVKNQLQQCETDNEQLKEELDQLKECHRKAKLQFDKDLDKAQKTIGHLKKKIQTTKCCICQDRVKNILLRPCKHLSLCEQCLDEVLARRDKVCPLCRKKIEDHDRVFS